MTSSNQAGLRKFDFQGITIACPKIKSKVSLRHIPISIKEVPHARPRD